MGSAGLSESGSPSSESSRLRLVAVVVAVVAESSSWDCDGDDGSGPAAAARPFVCATASAAGEAMVTGQFESSPVESRRDGECSLARSDKHTKLQRHRQRCYWWTVEQSRVGCVSWCVNEWVDRWMGSARMQRDGGFVATWFAGRRVGLAQCKCNRASLVGKASPVSQGRKNTDCCSCCSLLLLLGRAQKDRTALADGARLAWDFSSFLGNHRPPSYVHMYPGRCQVGLANKSLGTHEKVTTFQP